MTLVPGGLYKIFRYPEVAPHEIRGRGEDQELSNSCHGFDRGPKGLARRIVHHCPSCREEITHGPEVYGVDGKDGKTLLTINCCDSW